MRKLSIVKHQETEYYIVTSQFADRAELYAASELQKYLYESLNVYIPYFSDRCLKRGKEIYIGKTARDIGKNLSFEDVGEEGFVIQTLDNQELLIAGNSGRGTLYGVYAFLEKFLGFRRFSKDVERINHGENLEIEPCRIVENPAFEYRDVYTRTGWHTEFAVKNRLNGSVAVIPKEMGGKTGFFNSHHSFFDLVPPKFYAEAHPEYYSQNAGEESGKQLCLSNPDVYDIARKQLVQWIVHNPECRVFSVGQNDNGGYCRCEKCRKTDEENGGPSGSVIAFVNKLARSIKNEYPHVLLHTFAYRYSRKAPAALKVEDNVIVRLCNIECERAIPFEKQAQASENEKGVKEAKEFLKNVKEWSAICKRLYVWDYTVNYNHYLLPLLPLHVFAENIKTYRQSGVQGVLMEGNFSYGGDANMGDLKTYVLSKLLWNPDADVDGLIDEYLNGVFGKGAGYLKEYVSLMENAVTGKHTNIYDGNKNEYISEELIQKADALFQKAVSAETDPVIKERIEKEALAADYLKTVYTENREERAKKADELYQKLKHFKITEIRERSDLRKEIEWIKAERYGDKTTDWYSLYYIVR